METNHVTEFMLAVRLTHGLLYIWTELLSIFLADMRRELGTQITPWGWIFWTLIFYDPKKFTSRSI